MTLRGRHWVIFWLFVALATALLVTYRQTSANLAARDLRAARDERAALEAQKGELERRIRLAASRQELVPRAEGALGLHEPTATEMTVLSVPADAPGGLPDEVAGGATPDSVKKAPAKSPVKPKPKATSRTTTRRAPAHKAPARTPARPPARRRH